MRYDQSSRIHRTARQKWHSGKPVTSSLIKQHLTGGQARHDSWSIQYYDRDDPIGIQQIGSVAWLLHQRLNDGKRVQTQEPALRILSPYVFTVLENGLILPLNRLYKPLGLFSGDVFVDYEGYSQQAIPANMLNMAWCKQIENHVKVEHCSHSMFHDGCSPWVNADTAREYLIRLKGLLRMMPPDYSGYNSVETATGRTI